MNFEDQSFSSSKASDKPRPPAKSRAPEFYGFVAWASTSVLFFVYILWALFPDEWIKALGVEWYPNR
jgi:phosphatidylinositol glycan class P protein